MTNKIIRPNVYHSTNLAGFQIREAILEDAELLYRFILQLAKHEQRPEAATGTPQEIAFWLFEQKVAQAVVCEYETKPVGYAIFYPVFSSFKAATSLYLEDLYIMEQYRGKGFGKETLLWAGKTALEKGCSALSWSCLANNHSAVEFYHSLGAQTGNSPLSFSLPKSTLAQLTAKTV